MENEAKERAQIILGAIAVAVAATVIAGYLVGERGSANVAACALLGLQWLIAIRLGAIPRGYLWAAVLMFAVAAFLFFTGDAHAACRDIHGYWTVSMDGPSEHESGGNTVELRRATLAPGYDYAEAQLHLDPNASWAGCGVINWSLHYTLTLEQLQGIPQAAVYMATGASDDQTGVAGTKEDVWAGSMTGPGDLSFGGWLNGTMSGAFHATLSSQWTIAPQRMSPQVKRRMRGTIDALAYTNDATKIAAAGAVAAKAPVLASLFSVSLAATEGMQRGFQKVLDEDPWDAKYKTVVTVSVPAVPASVKGVAFRALVKNEYALRANVNALLVSTNRANTAMAMSDAVAEDRQQGKIDALVRRIGLLLGKEADLRIAASAKIGSANPLADPQLLEELRAAAAVMAN